MDEESRAAIDELLASTRKRSRPPEVKDYVKARRVWERATDAGKISGMEVKMSAILEEELSKKIHSAYGISDEVKPFSAPPCRWCYHPDEAKMDLSKEVATLSVDTSAAAIVLKAPMNDAIIAKINQAIPLTMREWLEDKHAWRFSPAAMAMLKPLLKATYKDVQTLGVPKALPATKFDQLIAKLDKDDKDKIYKLLAMRYHPDRGGSKETMILINLVFKGG